MGVSFSQQAKIIDEVKSPISKDGQSQLIKDSLSSFHGVDNDIDLLTVETKQDSRKDSNNFSDVSTTKNCPYISDILNQEKEEALKNLVPYTFIWQEEGESVFLVGSFGTWNQRYFNQ